MAQLSEERWTDLISLWLSELRDWGHWIETSSSVEVGSDLALDDDLLPGAPTSGSAFLGIQSAVDHLGVLGDALRTSGVTRPFGYYTLARAAMFGAARTVWILSPAERELRQERGLWMEWQSDRFFSKSLAQFQAQPDPGRRAVADGLADRVAGHLTMLGAAASRIGVELLPKHAPSDTEIVEHAGRWIEDRNEVDSRLGSGLAWQWRTHSGAAHSLPWILVGKADLETVYPDGTGEGVMAPSIEDLGVAMGTAMLATRSAIKLFGTRAVGPRRRPSA